MIFKTSLAKENWEKKYQYKNESELETFIRCAKTLASVEKDPQKWYKPFLQTLLKFDGDFDVDDNGYPNKEPMGLKVTLGGRITANLGTDYKNATLMNCFINGPVSGASIKYKRQTEDKSVIYDVDIETDDNPDDLTNIFLTIMEQAKTLASEGGYGINLGFIRPRNAVIKGTGIRHPGVLSYAKLWDTVSECMVKGTDDGYVDKLKNHLTVQQFDELKNIMKRQTRKGAMMGVLPCHHPDIEEFIRVKQSSGVLTKFNLSVLIDDKFMEAVVADDLYDLHFKGKVYKRIKARELYDLIMQSTYNRAEPGVLFVDNMHRNNPLAYLGKCDTTNPCVIGSSIAAVADGRNGVTFKQLAEEAKDVPVYSRNFSTGAVEIKMGRNPRKTGEKKEVWKLTLDDNSYFIATPDHKICSSKGTEINLKDLIPGDSIVPFDSYISYGHTTYRQIAQSSKLKKSSGLCLSRRQYRLIYEFYYPNDLIDSKLHRIHHDDFNHYNDRPENLKKMTVEEHDMVHDISGKKNPMYDFPKRIKDPERYHKNMSEAVSGLKNGRAAKISNEDYFNKIIEIIKNFKIKYKKSPCKREIIQRLKTNKLPTFSKYRLENLNYATMSKMFKAAERIAEANHKVKSIEFYGYEDVYNITVDDNHNYAVITSFDDDRYLQSSGIFVKNCGEIGGLSSITTVCLLGSLNITQYIYIDKDGKPQFDIDQYAYDIGIFARMLDNVNDLTNLPLPSYEYVVRNFRQFGMGINGLGSALFMLGMSYNSKEAIKFTKKICELKENLVWQASALLAKEKGTFTAYNTEKFQNTEYFLSDRLWNKTKELIIQHGVRNAKTTTNPPLGNSSIVCNNVSNAIEPVFSLEYERIVICGLWPEGLSDDNVKDVLKYHKKKDFEYWRGSYNGKIYYYEPHNRGLCEVNIVRDYGYQWLLDNFPDKDHSAYLVTTKDLKTEDHLNIQEVVQYYCNQSVSKTCNVPHDFPFENFKQLYIDAWKRGLNGFTTYRDGCMESVISSLEEANKEQKIIKRDIKLPEVFLNGPTRIIKREGQKFYIHFSFLPEDTDMKYPICLWIYSNSREIGQVKVCNKASRKLAQLAIEKGVDNSIIQQCIDKAKVDYSYNRLGRMISLCLRHNIKREDILIALRNIEGDNISSLLTAVRKFISLTIKDGTVISMKCEACGAENSVIMEGGCYKCLQCGDSRCG